MRYVLAIATLPLLLSSASAQTADQVDTIKDAIIRLERCWRPPSLSRAHSIEIAVTLSFNRSGAIMGQPKIRYETPAADDNDRLEYRIAVMETLQRCTPLPFTETMGGAVAGHPFWVKFQGPQVRPTPEQRERRAWLLPKIL